MRTKQEAEEDRIRRHYKSLRKSQRWYNYSYEIPWMFLARRWKRPIREIKEIVGYAEKQRQKNQAIFEERRQHLVEFHEYRKGILRKLRKRGLQ